jgi:KUP system potassium uptake protein
MDNSRQHSSLDKITSAGLLVALGIVFGDIGTSPLYVFRSIASSGTISKDMVFGGLSCVFWTLTLLTTIKYVILMLRAENKGEGGILSLYALVRRHHRYLTIPAVIGASTMLADSIITPPISVSSAVEGLNIIYPDLPIIPIIVFIISGLFLLQILGTDFVGKAFGPVMTVWFGALGAFGLMYVVRDLSVLEALNPYYAYIFLKQYPGGFALLGSIFLCTTGAEALYSDMGHVGRGNIRISWVFVKVCLLLNYFGQGAYVLTLEGQSLGDNNPFFNIIPNELLIFSICLAAAATVIASQSMITGVFTLIAEAIKLNFWPKVRIKYPSLHKGQIYIASINIMLFIGCMAVIAFFNHQATAQSLLTGKKVLLSSAMEAAYGLAIVLTMLMNTILFTTYMYVRHYSKAAVLAYFGVFFIVEMAFLIANIEKFLHGGWVPILIALCMISIMFIWLSAKKIKKRLTEYVKLDSYLEALKELSADNSVPKYATHLAFLSNANRFSEIEHKIIYSIFNKRPKRADIYWFLHIDTLDDPYAVSYKVKTIVPNDVYKVNFMLGFKVPQKINLYFNKVLEDLVKEGEVDIISRYDSLNKLNVSGDVRFVVLEKFLSYENNLNYFENVVMNAYFAIKTLTTSEDKWFGLDSSSVKVEKYPLVIRHDEKSMESLKRVPWN